MIPTSAGEVADMLARDAHGVAQYLLPNGRHSNGEWCVGSVDGEAGESLKVRLKGGKAGRWADFADNGQSGDLVDLWAATRGLSIGEAIAEACDYLGIEKPKMAGDRQRVKLKPPEGMRRASSDPVMEWLTVDRALPPEVIREYRVAEHNGAVSLPAVSPCGGHVQYLKYRSIKAKKFWSEAGGRPCLFGWQAIPRDARSVVISEGELDALAWAAYGFPALSPTNGSGNCDWIDTEFDALARFDSIYLSYDMDEAGRSHLREIVSRLGEWRCRIVELPCKDANECRIQDVPDADMAKAIQHAKGQDPDELLCASEFAEAVVDEFHNVQREEGVRFPWRKGLDLFVFRPGEVSLMAGVNGHGKSEMAGHLTIGAIEQGEKCCVASMEFKPQKWLRRLARQAAAMPQPSPGYIRAIHDWYQGRLWVLSATGTTKASRILEVFRYAVRRYGIRWFVVDNLAKCGFAEDDYNGQKQFIDELTDFARDHDVHVQVCVHMRKGESEEKPAGKMDIKGTGAIVDMVDSALVIWRNKPKEEKRRLAEQAQEPFDEEKHPDAVLTCVKQRNGDHEPKIGLFFCPRSHQYLDKHGQSPHQFVAWSAGAHVHNGGAA